VKSRFRLPRVLFSAFFSIGLAVFFAKPSFATVNYTIWLANPEQHVFHVTMTIPDVAGEVTVQMPAWNALYQIRDFSSHVRQVAAFADGSPAPIEKIDKQTWLVKGNGTIRIEYSTYWDESSPFATQLNSEHAFINPAMILLYVEARRGERCEVSLRDIPAQWLVETASERQDLGSGANRVVLIQAPSYDALADAPIEVGKFEEFTLVGFKPEVEVVVHGDKWTKKRVEDDLKRICQYELKLMDGAPYERYLFIFHIGKGSGGGGMEHANSTAIGIPSDEYLPGVAAHEFFHLWNVKRIRPASLEPVDYTREQYTRALWFAEGVTSTYGAFTLVRSGIWTRHQFYADLSEQISELQARPANRWQSAEQSSLDAWLEKYPLYNDAEESVSYYTKGQILGDLLDILIRDRTNNEKSLDDVLRGMNDEFAKKEKMYSDSLDVRLMTEKVAGGSFEEFFQKYVAGTAALPYEQVLALAGLQLKNVERTKPALGFYAERDPNGAVTVRSVDGASSAAQGGLRAGDIITSWNGGDIPRRLERWIFQQTAGDVLRLRVHREDKEIALEFQLGGTEETVYEVEEDGHAPERARRIRDGLLHGVTQATAAVR
jgi:predicted metalloprotease with PDZ domain